jgi:transposase
MYMGIDWSTEKHDVMIQNEQGGEVLAKVIQHNADGFAELDKVRRQLKVSAADCIVGIESAHTLLIDFLWSAGYEQIYVVPPGTVSANRGRNRQSGARNDRYDSRVIAETLRTDLAKFHPWHPGSEGLQEMRVQLGEDMVWTKECTRLGNRLQQILYRYYPAALAVFPSWPTQIICHFLLTYPTPNDVDELSLEEFTHFAKSHHYPKPRLLPACYQRLNATYPVARPALSNAYADQTKRLAQALLHALRNKDETRKALASSFEQHEDAAIFASLPGTGKWLAPALLVKFGEDRDRFPSAAPLQALAGTCPVTYQSGKKRSVRFRRSCDHQFRHIVQQWARCATLQSDWAASYRHSVFTRHRSGSRADRSLANRLLAIAWKLWQTRTTYDETVHLQNCMKRRKPLH